jgi:hypothetical protein
MNFINYAFVTTIMVQVGFITTLLYCSPIVHGMWKSRLMTLLQLTLYVGYVWTRAWPFLAFILLMWVYVTAITTYFLHEAWTVSVDGQYTTHTNSAPLQF